MYLNLPTICTCVIVITGAVIATPILVKGFQRRGTGIKYESNFGIQRLPQLMILFNVLLIVLAFFTYIGLCPDIGADYPASFVLATGKPHGLVAALSWVGVAILFSGMIFMVGGWYCLGEYFTTDAEILDGQGVRDTGFFKYVMHPIYSGIIQCLLGASLASTSIYCALFTLIMVAPLWLRRAKYEEKNLLEHLGPDYKKYGDQLKWRRLVPTIFPFGV